MVLEVKNLKKSFEDKEVLHGINFKVESGKALGLLGRNGAGKTTTIRIIMDVFHANSGEVLLDGKELNRNTNIFGYLPEERGMYPKKVIREQMIYLAMLRGSDRTLANENTEKWLKRLGVYEYIDKKLETLSKGNQQKVQLASTLVADPEIIILDEPFSGLDPVNSQILKDVIRELIADGKIVIFSSHQMSYVEEFCDDIVIINKGDVALDGHLDDIKQEYGKGRKKITSENLTLDELEKVLSDNYSDMLTIERKTKHHIVFEIKNETSLWDILDRLKKDHIEIKSFGAYEPSLTDIFVSCVGDELVEETKNAVVNEEEAPKKKTGLFGKKMSGKEDK